MVMLDYWLDHFRYREQNYLRFLTNDSGGRYGKEHVMDSTRRGFRATTGAVVAQDVAKAQDHDHNHQVVPSDPALRVKSLESLLVDKGLVDRAVLDALVDIYEHKIGPRNGARVVAQAWAD